jgi:NAD(P)-dependent dehydrogenase (short-subunit alcohol dehydrogenase family)
LDQKNNNNSIRTYDHATAIITGGASGIGRALAEELSINGCEVVLADLQIELAEEVAANIRAAGHKAWAYKIDVSNFKLMNHLVCETIKRTGRLDYIFNNAGIGIGGLTQDYSIDDWNNIIDVNIRGVVNGIQAAYPVMVKQKFGHIVNISSMAGLVSHGGMAGYVMTKHAVVGLSLSLRIEAALHGIRISVVCPGVVRTPILQMDKYNKMLNNIPREQLFHFWERLRPVDPQIFTRKVLKQIGRNRAIIIVPSWWKIFWWIYRLLPSAGLYMGQLSFVRMYNEANRRKLRTK